MKTAVVPDPVCVNPPGEAVIVQLPTEGKPLNETDPVDTEQVGWVVVPITGAVGVYTLIAAVAEATDVHPEALITVNVYVVFGVKPVKVVVVPVPVDVKPPGEEVIVHVPEDGKPDNATLPVGDKHDGCVIAPITGAVGFDGIALITAFDDANEVQPAAFVTVNEYVVDGFNALKLVVVPLPVSVAPPGLAVTVQDPVEGKLDKATVPVGVVHVG